MRLCCPVQRKWKVSFCRDWARGCSSQRSLLDFRLVLSNLTFPQGHGSSSAREAGAAQCRGKLYPPTTSATAHLSPTGWENICCFPTCWKLNTATIIRLKHDLLASEAKRSRGLCFCIATWRLLIRCLEKILSEVCTYLSDAQTLGFRSKIHVIQSRS